MGAALPSTNTSVSPILRGNGYPPAARDCAPVNLPNTLTIDPAATGFPARKLAPFTATASDRGSITHTSVPVGSPVRLITTDDGLYTTPANGAAAAGSPANCAGPPIAVL